MRLIVGCPVYNRDWILGDWLAHLEEWRSHYVDIFYCFVIGSEGAWGSLPQVLFQIPEDRRRYYVTRPVKDASLPAMGVGGPEGVRDWSNHARVQTMVRARNTLKEMVADVSDGIFTQPDAFLSIDSDILVSPWEDSKRLFNTLKGCDAVAPLVYLGATEGNAFTKRAIGQPASRVRKFDYMQEVDVICAAKLMTMQMVWDPRVVYDFDPRGEDFGWSQNARQHRYQLAFDPVVRWKHVMNGEQLGKVDRRIGW